jgi:hypothetical protein
MLYLKDVAKEIIIGFPANIKLYYKKQLLLIEVILSITLIKDRHKNQHLFYAKMKA